MKAFNRALSVLIGALALLLASPAGTAPPGPRLDFEIYADRTTYGRGEVPSFGVRIVNRSSQAIYMVEPLDGSDVGWRFPKYRLEVIDAAGKPVPVSGPGDRCGNMSPLVPEDFTRVGPGKSFFPFGDGLVSFLHPHVHLPGPGIYRFRWVYTTASRDIRAYYGDELRMNPRYRPSAEMLRRFLMVPMVELRSNYLTLKFTGQPKATR